MTDSIAGQGRSRANGMESFWSRGWSDVLSDISPPVLFALRLWASVSLAFLVAFWLQLDNPFWAGTSAAIVCQPQLGASLRKGWFRMIGTVVGATMVVVLTALFPQDRIAFLAFLALWCATCAFAATLLSNFASYSAALAGYTAAIVSSGMLGATGGASAGVFMLAIWRASEICIGIVCAGIVLAGTDLGDAPQQLAESLADLAVKIARGFTATLSAGPQLLDTQPQRCELLRLAVALDPVIDQALGESSHVRYYAAIVARAAQGLVKALEGWRGVAAHLARLGGNIDKPGTETILSNIPPEMRLAGDSDAVARWTGDPVRLRRLCDKAVLTLLALPTETPSLRFIADQTARVLVGMSHVLDGLALLVGASERPPVAQRGFQLSVPDYLPAFLNGVRAFVMIAAVEAFWLITAWPSGFLPIVFVAITMLLLSPRGDLAYHGAIAFAISVVGSILCAATLEFVVLPAFETFPAFCLALGLVYVPAGFVIAKSKNPGVVVIFTAMAVNFMPLLRATNEMTYDAQQFYNSSLAVLVGCGIAPVAFLLIPPLSSATRTRRLLAFALRDLRRIATTPMSGLEDWERNIYSRIVALPDSAEPLQKAQLLAALSVGREIIELRRIFPSLGGASNLGPALAAIAQGNSALARTRLARLDHYLVSHPVSEPQAATPLRARASILMMSEALAQHADYFDAGARA